MFHSVGRSRIVAPWLALLRLTACAVCVASAACAGLNRASGAGAPEDDSDIATIKVSNANKLNVVVYNVVHGARDRLGEVTAVSTSTFRVHVKRLTANEIQLYADPVGASRGVTSERLRLTAGDHVEWMLETDLSRSHIEIR